VHSDRVRRNELTPYEHCAEDDLQPLLKCDREVEFDQCQTEHKVLTSKKLSPIMMTESPPLVQPSLGDTALMQGVAIGREG